MDSEQFDGLVRRVGQARSRRGVLGGLGKGLGAVALGMIGLSRLEAAEAGKRRVKCPDPSLDGTYGGSCSVTPRCTADGTLLSGTCEDGNTDWWTGTAISVPAEILVNSCKRQRYVIANCGGTLTCGNC